MFQREENHMRAIVLGSLFIALATAGCGQARADGNKQNAAQPPAAVSPLPQAASPTPAEQPKPAAVQPTAPAQHVELEIASVANTMTFDKTKLTVPAGAEVHLVFKNNSTMSTLPHNWVLVKPGTEASVAAAGLKLGEQAGYFDVRDKDALVHTPMTKPGESADVTFTAPEPGSYPYICSVPGHYMMMKGVLTVTP
jgi:azurin